MLIASALGSNVSATSMSSSLSCSPSCSVVSVDSSDGTFGRRQDHPPELPHGRGQDYRRGANLCICWKRVATIDFSVALFFDFTLHSVSLYFFQGFSRYLWPLRVRFGAYARLCSTALRGRRTSSPCARSFRKKTPCTVL